MEQEWLRDPSSVGLSWRVYFENLSKGLGPGRAFIPPPSVQGYGSAGSPVPPYADGPASSAGGSSQADLTRLLNVMMLIRSYQIRGHEIATTDPLKMYQPNRPPELSLEAHHLSEADLDVPLDLSGASYLKGLVNVGRTTLRELVKQLEAVYCGNIGFEYMHIQSREECNWLRARFEKNPQFGYTVEHKKKLLMDLMKADLFEETLRKKYPSQKGFGLEGAWSFIPCVQELIQSFHEQGGEHLVFGMAHRGRLCFLSEVMGKPRAAIFKEFNEGGIPVEKKTEDFSFMGDVKYHLGASSDRTFPNGKSMHLTLMGNPSHLEAVNPVVEGKCRARQQFMGDTQRTRAMSVTIHGDASFAGQGIVAEVMELSGLDGYTTGGTVHIIIDNRIGFTTNPRDARTSQNPTDLAKAIGAPIFHVNGDDPEAVAFVARLAVEWRQTFHKDVVIDLVCYRKFGHNEGDQPRFTQPFMYSLVDKARPTLELYKGRLMSEGVITEAEFKAAKDAHLKTILQDFDSASTFSSNMADVWGSSWDKMVSPAVSDPRKNTSISQSAFKKVLTAVSSYPETFDIHPTIKKIYAERAAPLTDPKAPIDWGTAEAIAFGSLVNEGYLVRVSGQDVERGTFSHRHAVIHSQSQHGPKNPLGKYTPLRHVDPKQAEFEITNSCLSEYAVLGFEFGFSIDHPDALVVWEAQFGDFVNGAQIVLDQFITSSESKWRRQTGLVVLLPHGYENGGPEHSSCRPERILQNYDDNEDVLDLIDPIQSGNFVLVNMTTPANYFHVLRLQLHKRFRKPLFVVAPKKLLKFGQATSRASDFTDGAFQEFIPETQPQNLVDDANVAKVIFCTGKVYFDLLAYRTAKNIKDTAIVRLEQIAPFPYTGVVETLKKYKNAKVVWCQEEPKNQGFFPFTRPRLRTAARGIRDATFDPLYAGRGPAPQPAIGNSKVSEREQIQLVVDAFSL